MRILLKFISLQDAKYEIINNYIIQGFIYNLLKDTEFAWVHSYKGYKYFNFSNIFPVEDLKIDKKYNLIISSPNKKIINVMYEKLKEIDEFKLGILDFKIIELKKFELELRFPWETATPIILKKGYNGYLSDGFNLYKVFTKDKNIFKEFKKEKIRINKDIKDIKVKDIDYLDKNKFRIIRIDDVYYSFEKDLDNFFDWLEDLKKNSLLKYNSYTGSEFTFDEPLFDEFEYRREIPVKARVKNRGDVTYIGTLWRKLNVIRNLDREEKRFYKFLFDTGLGLLNSMGFGFINLK
ncbi:CRISPR-associated protein Cas6 [Nanobdella aerobiophila]|uniref:CRISPR-associated protein Cas6 n=1 Tax=Nanobdella aerobiophila TaxID=2586965 RepID=A0A915T057_9ARCH|nr:CRISPR-associated endoribonuclease Cas6 [Nanobdella aerobiophila]BBL45724.1 CRISPR-associated protein Cas6 [Nanobdella aerobiophila]